GSYHGFTYDRGEYGTFDAPAGVNFGLETWIWDIGATGAMTGGFTDSDGVYRGFILDNGAFTRIMVPGSAWTEGFGINARGEVTGHFANPGSSQMFGFVYRDGEFTTILDYPGEDDWMSCSMGIGVHGETVGHVAGTYPDATYGYVWHDDTYTALLRVPEAAATYPTAIGADGTIAGYAVLTGGERVGFVARPK
ncbi:MAG: hypothetical protein GWM90_11070, partial [Gemmatimonadetes bacterium]|nr:hypothetical protein [Gemmatimonadota bacterium]NIQ54502.1 hypothetical protein [Gemmatimonadota bacterium]NIU74708.1 hypothetical protein [Gammaproteobacteria bacterium]NIX44633.1 hypothetical protein [Gemmatimonadota bacterium]NIY08858.1 hypothetical protein [Gemmatimonadota bacterium]